MTVKFAGDIKLHQLKLQYEILIKNILFSVLYLLVPVAIGEVYFAWRNHLYGSVTALFDELNFLYYLYYPFFVCYIFYLANQLYESGKRKIPGEKTGLIYAIIYICLLFGFEIVSVFL